MLHDLMLRICLWSVAYIWLSFYAPLLRGGACALVSFVGVHRRAALGLTGGASMVGSRGASGGGRITALGLLLRCWCGFIEICLVGDHAWSCLFIAPGEDRSHHGHEGGVQRCRLAEGGLDFHDVILTSLQIGCKKKI